MDMRVQETTNVISIASRIPAEPTKLEMVAAIQDFCIKRNFEDALSQQEIARLEKFDRVDAQRKSLLINVAKYYRDNPKADVAVGVLTIITLLSDNDKGACTMSQTHIGLILSRSRTTISEAVTRLKASGLVQSENGKSLAYPTIPRVVTQHYNHVVWVAEALKSVPTCRHHGTGLNLSASRDTCNTPVPSKRQVNAPTCPVVASEPVGSTGHNFTKENSTTLNRETVGSQTRRAAISVAIGIATAAAPMAVAAQPEPIAIVQTAKPSLSDLTNRMMDAAGNAIANPAGAMGLLTYSEQSRWLSAGCDIDLDILPAIRARAARAAPGSIKSWAYFTQAIADERAKRTAPMPEATRENQTLKGSFVASSAKNWHDEQDMLRAKLKASRAKNG